MKFRLLTVNTTPEPNHGYILPGWPLWQVEKAAVGLWQRNFKHTFCLKKYPDQMDGDA
jgi:hypothetical protein